MTTTPEPRAPYGAALLDQVRGHIGRFATLPSQAALDVSTLWAAHTHVRDANERLAFGTTPRLAFISDQPASGKTRALEIVLGVSFHGQIVIDSTPASFALMVSEKRATVGMDEMDILFGAGGAKSVLRSLLNSGYKAGATWPRANKDDLPVFAPVALAGLGHKFRTTAALSTLRSRSIMVEMKRGTPPESYRARLHDRTAEMLRTSLTTWAKRNIAAITDTWPDMPEGITDRNAEIAEPLLMIADVAGGHWPATARAAVRELLLGQAESAEEDVPLWELLAEDLRLVFGTADKLSSSDVVAGLHALPGAPWAKLWPDVANAPRELSAMLAPLGVAPVRLRFGDLTVRGYKRGDIETLTATNTCSIPVPDQDRGGVAGVADDDAELDAA